MDQEAADPSSKDIESAVRGGILDAVGTIWLLVLAVFFLAAGVQGLFVSGSIVGISLSAASILLAFGLVAFALDIVP